MPITRDGRLWKYESTIIVLASLSRVICDNTGIQKIQPDAFLSDQTRVNCNTLPSVNLEAWKDTDCFIKISVTGQTVKIYVDYYVDIVLTEHKKHSIPKCVPIQCPQSSQDHIIIVEPTKQKDDSCTADANPNMPSDQTHFIKYKYTGKLNASLIDANTGIYSTMVDCTSGDDYAVKFTDCSSQIQENEEDLPEEEEMNQIISAPSINDNIGDTDTMSDRDLLKQLEATLEELNWSSERIIKQHSDIVR